MSCGLQYKAPTYSITDKQKTELKDVKFRELSCPIDRPLPITIVNNTLSVHGVESKEPIVLQRTYEEINSSNAEKFGLPPGSDKKIVLPRGIFLKINNKKDWSSVKNGIKAEFPYDRELKDIFEKETTNYYG